MGIFFLVVKSLLIIFFLVMFLRTNRPAWGVGLLTVTSAILLDAFLGTLGREQMMEELGFFFYFLSGALVAGAAAWFWAIVKPFVYGSMPSFSSDEKDLADNTLKNEDRNTVTQDGTVNELIEEMRTSFEIDDLRDLLFDLGYHDLEDKTAKDRDDQLVENILRYAEEQGELEKLPAAIERIKSPIPIEHLPRLEKINSETPPTILRHYLLSVCSLPDLDRLGRELDINISDDESDIRKFKVRQLLSELYERNEIRNLIELLQASANEETAADHEIQE